VIGNLRTTTVRREYLDYVFFWNAIDLRRKLGAFADYYNAHRVHRSLNGSTPARRACASSPPAARAALRQHAWEEHCRGLFHTPIPAWYQFASGGLSTNSPATPYMLD
jgi:hypothetical protein